MKRALSLCLALVLIGGLCACGSATTNDTVEFYYQRDSYVYGSSDGIIASETREVTNRVRELPYLLSLYLRGPLDEELRAPFPAGCKLLSVSQDGSTLCVTLSSTFTTLEDMELTIACACIAKTCFSLSDVTQVQIRSAAPEDADSVNMVISIDSLLLYDSSGLNQQAIIEESQ